MKTLNRISQLRLAVAALVLGGLAAAAVADSDRRGGERERGDKHRYDVSLPAYKEECGSCHVAYPPQLLPAASWRALMAGLDRHFGSDASLDAAKQREITDFLVANAGRRDATGADGKPLLRISQTRWFVKEHDEVPAAAWKDAAVKSAANCGACHREAESGDYSERHTRIPK